MFVKYSIKSLLIIHCIIVNTISMNTSFRPQNFKRCQNVGAQGSFRHPPQPIGMRQWAKGERADGAPRSNSYSRATGTPSADDDDEIVLHTVCARCLRDGRGEVSHIHPTQEKLGRRRRVVERCYAKASVARCGFVDRFGRGPPPPPPPNSICLGRARLVASATLSPGGGGSGGGC